MKIKSTILLILGVLLLSACSQRSYVMSIKPVSGNDPKYTVPKELAASSTTPDKVKEPYQADKKPRSVYSSKTDGEPITAQTTTAINEEFEDVPYTQESANNPFVGNESEHIKFSSYNPFENGTFTVDLDAAASGFTYPINGKFSSGYGRRGRGTHTGVDLVAPALTSIYAAFDGVVRLAKPYSGYGNVIVVRHPNGLETVYAHNTKNLVSAGQTVTGGQEIAKCGRTGRATTNHLHFEVRIQGQTINPILLIDVHTQKLQSGKLVVNRSSGGTVTAKLTTNAQKIVPATKVDNTKVLAKNEETTGKENVNEDAESKTVAKPAAPASPRESKGIRVGDTIYDAPKSSGTEAKYHNIKSGDTLSTIARKYATTVSELCRINSITKDTVIKIGKKLRVK